MSFERGTESPSGTERERGGSAPPIPSRPGQRLDPRVLRPDLKAVVSVSGTSSNAGKTHLAERLITWLVGRNETVTALKVTRTHIGTCARENDACHVCDDLEAPWRIIDDARTIRMPRKDTGRMLAAGAAHVVWLIVQPAHMSAGIEAVLRALPEGGVLVAEGNSFRDYVETCDLSLMAFAPRPAMKASARHVLDRIDAFVARPEDMGVAERILQAEGLGSPRVVSAAEIETWAAVRL